MAALRVRAVFRLMPLAIPCGCCRRSIPSAAPAYASRWALRCAILSTGQTEDVSDLIFAHTHVFDALPEAEPYCPENSRPSLLALSNDIFL